MRDLRDKSEHTWVINSTLKRFKLLSIKLNEHRSTHTDQHGEWQPWWMELLFQILYLYLPCDVAVPSSEGRTDFLPHWGATWVALANGIRAHTKHARSRPYEAWHLSPSSLLLLPQPWEENAVLLHGGWQPRGADCTQGSPGSSAGWAEPSWISRP